MKLLLDIGNSRLKWAWWDQGLKPGGAQTHVGQSPEAVLAAIDLRLMPTQIWAASVAAPILRAALEAWAMRHCNVPVRWVHSQSSACGVHNAYARPERLGVDRWLAVIAAYHRVRGAAFVVDAGTALTVDAVDTRGRHLGGLIAPGLGTQRQSLHKSTQLRASTPEGRADWLGADTDMAVAWGTLHGVIGFVERVYTGIRREHGDIVANILPIITGGEASLLLPYLGPEWVAAPDLVLEGLAHVAVEAEATPLA
ncbi:MAG: type III pantothenate kinase [Nevskiales bacterium]